MEICKLPFNIIWAGSKPPQHKQTHASKKTYSLQILHVNGTANKVFYAQDGKTWIQLAKASAALSPVHVLVSILNLGSKASNFSNIKGLLAFLQEMASDPEVPAEDVKNCILPIFQASIYSLLEISARSALEIKNAKMFGLLLQLAENVLVITQKDDNSPGISLQAAIYEALKANGGQSEVLERKEKSAEIQKAAIAKQKKLLGSFTCDMANLLSLSIKNGSSKAVIEFLRFKPLLAPATIEIDDTWAISRMLKATQDTTCLTSDKVICESCRSSSLATCFQRVWYPLFTDRVLLLLRRFLKPMSPSKRKFWTGALVTAGGFFSLVCAVPLLVVYTISLVYVNLLHGFRLVAESDDSDSLKRSAVPFKLRCRSFLYRPFALFFSHFKGNQSVTAHTLSLPGMGSLKNLKIFVRAPVDLFETPTIRAVVKGMWSRFVYGFYARLALYILQLILYSLFACWCVGNELTLDTLREGDDLAQAAFSGGCVAIAIGVYFLGRECLHCISCLMNEGLKDYLAVGSVMRICSHTLEIASLVMFVQKSNPGATRLVATYAVFTLWINLMYLSKAIKQISYLVEILTVILMDLIPFMTIMLILIMAVTLALIVLIGHMASVDQKAQFGTFSFSLDYVFRVAEGRLDIDGSALSSLLQDMDRDDPVQSAVYHTAYFYFYFLMCVISVVALNAFIALMGSSYEKVTEKKISQR
jgi:hypothetical protein